MTRLDLWLRNAELLLLLQRQVNPPLFGPWRRQFMWNWLPLQWRSRNIHQEDFKLENHWKQFMPWKGDAWQACFTWCSCGRHIDSCGLNSLQKVASVQQCIWKAWELAAKQSLLAVPQSTNFWERKMLVTFTRWKPFVDCKWMPLWSQAEKQVLMIIQLGTPTRTNETAPSIYTPHATAAAHIVTLGCCLSSCRTQGNFVVWLLGLPICISYPPEFSRNQIRTCCVWPYPECSLFSPPAHTFVNLCRQQQSRVWLRDRSRVEYRGQCQSGDRHFVADKPRWPPLPVRHGVCLYRSVFKYFQFFVHNFVKKTNFAVIWQPYFVAGVGFEDDGTEAGEEGDPGTQPLGARPRRLREAPLQRVLPDSQGEASSAGPARKRSGVGCSYPLVRRALNFYLILEWVCSSLRKMEVRNGKPILTWNDNFLLGYETLSCSGAGELEWLLTFVWTFFANAGIYVCDFSKHDQMMSSVWLEPILVWCVQWKAEITFSCQS